eukprot:s2327_g11.t1
MAGWQMTRFSFPDFATLSIFIYQYQSPDPKSEWVEVTESVGRQLDKVQNVDVFLKIRDRYQCTTWIVKRVVIGGPMPFVMVQHFKFPEVLVMTHIRSLITTLQFSMDYPSVVATAKTESNPGNHFRESFDPRSSPRYVVDSILHWLRLSGKWTSPELRCTFTVYVQCGPDARSNFVLDRVPEKTLGALLIQRQVSMGVRIAIARDDDDEWIIPASDEDADGPMDQLPGNP